MDRQLETPLFMVLFISTAVAWLTSCGETETGRAQHGDPWPPDGAVGGAGGDGASGGSGSSGASSAGGSAGSNAGGTLGIAGADAGTGAGGSGDAGRFPPRPTWQPDFPLEAPGWRQSTEPFCSRHLAILHPSVWSTPEATWVLVHHYCNGFIRDYPCTLLDSSGAALYRNEGQGWSVVAEDVGFRGPYAEGLTGLGTDDSAVIWGGSCAIEEVKADGTRSCLSSATEQVIDARGANGRLFALFNLAVGDPSAGPYDPSAGPYEVRTFASGTWDTVGTVAAPEHAHRLATDGENVLVWGPDQLVMAGTGQPGSLAPVASAPAGDYSAGWVFGAGDFVLASDVGQLARFNAGTWSVLDLGVTESVRQLWAAPDRSLYFLAGSAFGRVRGDEVEVLVDSGGFTQYFVDLWGNSSTEVFLTLNDSELAPYQCGASVALWFDGAELHAF